MRNSFGYGAPQVRLTQPNDVNSITALDMKCYQYPLSLEGWKQFLSEVNDTNRVVVLEKSRRAIGFAAYELVEDLSTGDSHVEITKLGILPEYRRQGHGSTLIESIEGGARRLKADRISILIPEIHCFPGDPDDVSLFLKYNGYYPSGVIKYNCQVMYGHQVDGFYFVKEKI